MKTTLLKHLMLFVIVAFVGILINSCGSDTVTTNTNPTYDAKSINGTINFVETSFLDSSSGSYLIAAYPESGWPPLGGPTAFATIPVVNGTASYNYKLTDLADGNYVVSVGFRKNTGGQSPIMGIYGCDTSHSFTCLLTPTLKASITNSAGVGNITFLSWADTTNKIY